MPKAPTLPSAELGAEFTLVHTDDTRKAKGRVNDAKVFVNTLEILHLRLKSEQRISLLQEKYIVEGQLQKNRRNDTLHRNPYLIVECRNHS